MSSKKKGIYGGCPRINVETRGIKIPIGYKKCKDCYRDWGHGYCGVCGGEGYVIDYDAISGPEYEDGCDHEGFDGGCVRAGHTPETCPHNIDL